MKVNEKFYFSLFFLIFFIFLIFFTKSQILNDNSAARFSTIDSLVENNSLAINEKKFSTVDKMTRDGNFYSSKPPVLSAIGAGIYYVLHNFFNLKLPETNTKSEYLEENNFSVYLITLLLSGAPYILLLFYFYKALKLFNINFKDKIILLLGLGAGTLYLPFSTVLNNHISAGCFLFASFYYLLKIRITKPSFYKINFYLVLSGFFASLSAVMDLPTGFTFLLLFFAYVCFFISPVKSIYYILSALPFIIIHLILNFQITGDFLPAQFHPEYAYHENLIWNRLGDVGQVNQQPMLSYAFNVFFGLRGLFIYSPVLIFSVYAIFKIIKNKDKNFLSEAILFLVGFLIISLFYIIKVRDYSGRAFGFRWFIAATPLLYFFMIYLFKKQVVNKFFTSILILSVIISLIGVLNPWPGPVGFVFPSGEIKYFDFPLASNVLTLKRLLVQ